MSDPVTNVEIEDVLSSIRRLVSEDTRMNPSENVASEADVSTDVADQEGSLSDAQLDAPAAPGALVLTAALRVVTPDETPEAAEPLVLSPADEAAEGEMEALEEQDPDEGAYEEYEEIDDDVDDELGDSGQDPVTYFDGQFEEPEEEGATVESETLEALSEEPDFTDPLPSNMMDAIQEENRDDAQAQQSIETKISALEALIARSDQEFEPDGAETSNAAYRAGSDLPWQHDVPPSVEDELPDPDAPSQSVSFDTEALSFEAAHDAAAQEVEEELVAVAQSAFEEVDDRDDETIGLDEEALRDMVTDIVRQELQGALGERITRNVRKLVRREIYRALAANELE